jgi:hypothetical protein
MHASNQAGRSVLATLFAGVLFFVALGVVFYFVNGFARSFSASTPRVQQAQAAEPEEDKLQITSTDTEVVVDVLPPGDDKDETLREIIDKPEDFIGKKVIVNGYIYKNIRGWGFHITRTKAEKDKMVVIALPQFTKENQLGAEPYRAGTAVSVEGTVKYFKKSDASQFDIGSGGVNFDQLFGQHVIVAERIITL